MTIFPESAGLARAVLIGEGGAGRVFAATHPDWGKVAVKVAIDNSPATAKLFPAEYTLLRSLFHPGIIQLHSFGYTDDKRPFIVMELLEGGDLNSWCDKQPLRKRFAPLGRIISALEYLHLLGIVHRDLKGENILLDTEARARLTDLGLAAGSGDQNVGRAGTVEYMAPEVINNREATVAADIYSLGVILYRVATGHPPFESADPLQVISSKHEPDSLDFAGLAGLLSKRFAQVVRRCLDPDPQLRPKTVREVAEQLLQDRLISRQETEAQSVDQFLHHYVWSFNVSFAKQELRQLDRSCLISDHFQSGPANLLETIADHLQISGQQLNKRDSGQIEFRDESNRTITIRLSGATPPESDQFTIDYPELDRFALDAFLLKLFPAGVDQALSDTIYRLSSGNIGLLRLLLRQFEEENFLDLKAGRIQAPRNWLLQFAPCEEYFQSVALMLPAVNEGALAAVSLLATDPFDNPRHSLLESLLRKGDLDALAESGILDPSSYQFRRSYYREYFYSRIDPDTRATLHREWVALLDNGQLVTDVELDEQLFYHLSRAGRIEPAVEVAIGLARRFRQEQKPDKARSYLLQARSLPLDGVNNGLQIQLLMISGDMYKDGGDFDRALVDYARLVRLATWAGSNEALAEAYKNLGDVYKGKRDYRRGNRALDHAVKLYGALNNELELSHCFNNIGNILWIVGDIKGAEVNYETALEIQRGLGVKKDIASTLNNLGAIKLMQQQFEEGIKLSRESIDIKREIGDWPELARTANNLAVAYFEMDELQTASEYLAESLRINLSQGAEKELLYNYENLCEVEVRRGNYAKAEDWVYAGLRLARQNDLQHRSNYASLLAAIMLRTGRYGKASNLLGVAGRLARQVDDDTLVLKVTETQAEYFLLVQDWDQMQATIATGLDYAEKLAELRIMTHLLIKKARMAHRAGAPTEAIWQPLGEAERVIAKLPLRREQLTILLDKVEFLLAAGDVAAAQSVFSDIRALPQFEGINTFQARISHLNALIERQRGQTKRSVTLLNDAVLTAKTMRAPEQAWRSLVALGDSYHSLTEYEQAFKCYIEAFGILKVLAGSISDPKQRTRYLSDPSKIAVAEKLEQMSVLAG